MQFYSFGNWQLDPNSRLCPGSVDHAAFFLSGALQCSAAARNVTSQLYICVSDNAIIVRSTMHDTAHSLLSPVLCSLQDWPQSDQWSVTRCRHDHGAAAWRSVLFRKSINRWSCTITEKAPTRAFSWLEAAITTFTFKTLLRHYAEWALTPQ